MPSSDQITFLSEVLDKLIETQVQTTKAAAELKNSVDNNNILLRDLHRLLDEINDHFSNGFRQDIKDHISGRITEIEKQLTAKTQVDKEGVNKILATINEFTTTIKNPKSWIAAFLFVLALIGAIGTFIAYVLKATGGTTP